MVHAGISGTLTAVDDKGVATVKTADGREYKLPTPEGWSKERPGVWKKGLEVECEIKSGQAECRPSN